MLAALEIQLPSAVASFLIGLLTGWGWLLLKPRLGSIAIKIFGRRGSHSWICLVGALAPFVVILPAVGLLIVISKTSKAEPLIISGSFVVAYMVTKFASNVRS